MKLVTVFLHVLCLRLVHAISVQDIPQCAQGCLSNSTSAQKSCSVIDIACLCSSSAYVSALSCCLYTDCNSDEQAVAIQFNKQECAAVNETAPDFVGCSPAGLSSALASMSLTQPSAAPSAPPASTSSSSSNPSLTTISGDLVSETAEPTTGKPITATTFVGAPLMTGSCTVPYFGIITDAAGRVTEYPNVGCSEDRPDCCPFEYGLNAVITRCPQDYFTTASACCPLGYQIYYTAVGQDTPCYSVPATTFVPASTPTVAGLTLITDHVFSQKYSLVAQQQAKSKFPPGAKIAIPVSIWVVICIVCITTFFWVRRRRKARRAAEANRTTTFPPEEPVLSQMSMSRAPTAHELDSPEARAGSPGAVGIANGWPIFPTSSPPAYDQNKGGLAAVQKQAPSVPQELPGSTFIHEHHPVFSSAGSVSTPTEATPGSPPGTPVQVATAGTERRSPVLSSVTSRSDTQSPVFVSPLGSPRLPKTG
ncbi:CFEM domain-containing protein [Cladophialophora immunda]|nr:CFEM domain-containing protein [Cladophialophora immunda]